MASHALGGALTAVGGITFIGGVAVHQPCGPTEIPPTDGAGARSCDQPVVNPATVIGALALGVGIWMIATPDHKGRQRRRPPHPRTRQERRTLAQTRRRRSTAR